MRTNNVGIIPLIDQGSFNFIYPSYLLPLQNNLTILENAVKTLSLFNIHSVWIVHSEFDGQLNHHFKEILNEAVISRRRNASNYLKIYYYNTGIKDRSQCNVENYLMKAYEFIGKTYSTLSLVLQPTYYVIQNLYNVLRYDDLTKGDYEKPWVGQKKIKRGESRYSLRIVTSKGKHWFNSDIKAPIMFHKSHMKRMYKHHQERKRNPFLKSTFNTIKHWIDFEVEDSVQVSSFDGYRKYFTDFYNGENMSPSFAQEFLLQHNKKFTEQ